jgi:hypothetical protein
VVNAGYSITSELIEPFRSFEPGERVSADVVATYRYDTYGPLIEQWIQVNLQRAEEASRGVVRSGIAELVHRAVAAHPSLTTSPPARVPRACQAAMSIELGTDRRLPSPIAKFTAEAVEAERNTLSCSMNGRI